MSKLEKYFENLLKEKSNIVNASNGKEFEEKNKAFLKKNGFSEMTRNTDEQFDKYVQSIKNVIQSKKGKTLIDNTLYIETANEMYTDCFVWQPYGSQDFPDFIVFTKNKIFSIETKYSTGNSKKPMWNSNVPKQDAIYIFGSYGLKDLTIFRGNDVLSNVEYEMFEEFWEKCDSLFKEYEEKRKKAFYDGTIACEYGFSPYIRRAYSQDKIINSNAIIDFFKNPNKEKLEKSAIAFIRDYDK